jgi:SAM-dependent methyltransferase
VHLSSMNNMKRCIEKYESLIFADAQGRRPSVVDIGSMDVNGTYRELFDPLNWSYVGIDMAPGKGVDLVIRDPYKFPLSDGSVDCVISGQMLEHNEFFWLTFAEKLRILRPTGLVFMIAPSIGPIHRFPVDCYRFYPDSYVALAKYTNSVLVDCWLDATSEWGDLVGVFSKTYRHGLAQFEI